VPTLSASERRQSLSKPVELAIDEAAAVREASRCLDCGVNTIFDGEKCVLCGGCVDVCPTSCLRLLPLQQIDGEGLEPLRRSLLGDESQDASAILKDEERCIRCGLCALRCPTDAVTMERYVFKEAWIGNQAHPA
jgi:ferredoxin